MSPKYLMFCALVMVVGVLVSLMMGGSYFGATEVSWINDLTVFRTYDVFNLISLPLLNIRFFTVGIPHLIMWDYAFFGGGYAIFQWFLYVITIGVVWGLVIAVIAVISNLVL